jgi:shikimate dehydrogenase
VRLALLGDPVAHSRSPAIHRAALFHVGIDGSYEARRVDVAGVAGAVAELRSGSLDGANVTMPHKMLAGSLCDRLHEEAAAARAVNTLASRSGELVGWNTDVTALREAVGDLAGRPVLVLGSGGAAAAALAAFGGGEVALSARRPEAAEGLVARVGTAVSVVSWGTVVSGAVVINATPLGMAGETLPPGVVESASLLIDLPYAGGTSPASAQAASLGIPAVDGLEMLVLQAGRSFEIWTGRAAPIEVMRAAARG